MTKKQSKQQLLQSGQLVVSFINAPWYFKKIIPGMER
jgi:hypothetical protein